MRNENFGMYLDKLDKLNNDEELFEEEFNKIRKDYPIKDCKVVHDFLKEKRGLIIILNEIRPLLRKYVPYAFMRLELDIDPIFVPQLLLFIRAPEIEYNNGFREDVHKINSIIEPLLFKLDLGIEFFIYKGIYRNYDGYCNVH